MRLNNWLVNLHEQLGDDAWPIQLRVVLKSGNEIEVDYDPNCDQYGLDGELTDGNFMIDPRSIAAIQVMTCP